ncbi:hypothetical protein Y1Q_0012632 [Alligator mississippiensis]|uniref:Uncharacterized protein n=1 Tax=Alligator mississippiensis TaxID=8496 RepID=A0A151M8B7_ALLMI|nr:hypothetical protein Y1Q_0012632 [Alligator mississippiensis]
MSCKTTWPSTDGKLHNSEVSVCKERSLYFNFGTSVSPLKAEFSLRSCSCTQGRGYTWQWGCTFKVTHSHPQLPTAQRWTQDQTILLEWLVASLEDQLEGSQAWRMEDITHEDAQDWADQEFWAQLLDLEHEYVDILREQYTILAQAVQTTDNDCQVLDTILSLVVTFVAPTAWPLTLALPALW